MVFIPKYRRKVLHGELGQYLRDPKLAASMTCAVAHPSGWLRFVNCSNKEGESWTNGRRSRRPRHPSRRHLRFGPLHRAGSDPERGRDLGDAGSAPGRPRFMKCPATPVRRLRIRGVINHIVQSGAL